MDLWQRAHQAFLLSRGSFLNQISKSSWVRQSPTTGKRVSFKQALCPKYTFSSLRTMKSIGFSSFSSPFSKISPFPSLSSFSSPFGHPVLLLYHLPISTSLYQLLLTHFRGLNVCLCNNDSAERDGKDSTSKLTEHNGFKQSWKLWLNLCWLRWLRTSLNLVSNLKPTGLWSL